MQFSIVLYCIVQYSKVHYYTVHYYTVQHSILQHNAVRYSEVLTRVEIIFQDNTQIIERGAGGGKRDKYRFQAK